jgi:hypothetical protein
VPSCSEHRRWTCALPGGLRRTPRKSRLERRHGFRQASWWLVWERTKIIADDTFGLFAAVDRGSEQHRVCILDAAGRIRPKQAFPQAVQAWRRSTTGWFPKWVIQPRWPLRSKYHMGRRWMLYRTVVSRSAPSIPSCLTASALAGAKDDRPRRPNSGSRASH